MATLTNEQIEQKKQLLAEKVKQMDAIFKELKEAGSLELSEEELDSVNGGMNDPRLTGILPELFLDRYKLPLDMLPKELRDFYPRYIKNSFNDGK